MKNKNQVMVIGASRLGAKIAMNLQESGEDVLVIDKDPKAFNKLEEFAGFTSIGDAMDLEFLVRNNITLTKKIIITTDDDNINIFLGYVSYFIYEIPKIYIRLSDSDKSVLLDNTSIKAIYPFLLSIDYFDKVEEGVIA